MQDKPENRWAGWIKTQEYRERLHTIEEHVRNLSSGPIDISTYTPHDSSHCLAVEKMVKALIEKSEVELSDLEKFILFSAVWTHDLGMFWNISWDFFTAKEVKQSDRTTRNARDRHDEISAWYLSSKRGEILKRDNDKDKDNDKESEAAIDNLLRNYACTINVISQFHRMKEEIHDCPKERCLKEEKIRTRLLACFLRLGDTLHVDSSRFNRRLYDVLQIGQLDRSARLHWLKSYVVSNVYLDPKNETVFVNIDLPVSFKSSQKNEADRKENVKNLEAAIINDIFEDVLVVRETFKDYGLPAYESVKSNICFVPGYSEKDSKEIKGIISDLGIAFSPNTSKVIEKAIDSIASICGINFEGKPEQFRTQMDQLLLYLRGVIKDRPCHVGLRKVTSAAEAVFNKTCPKGDHRDISDDDVKKCKDAINKKLEEIRNDRKRCIKELYDKCDGNVLDTFENIILFAYSETVTTFLDKYGNNHSSWKDRLKLYVLECSGKRRLTSNNNIEYNDGIYYALQLSKHSFKKVKLLPDTSISSLASYFKKNNMIQKSLVLFGVNGIDESTRDCGHTSGHLMIAMVANCFKIPVKVIADSFKIGTIDWNPSLTRETPWLTGKRDMLSDLNAHDITLTSCVEDRIPIKLINEIIKDGENIPGGQVLTPRQNAEVENDTTPNAGL